MLLSGPLLSAEEHWLKTLRQVDSHALCRTKRISIFGTLSLRRTTGLGVHFSYTGRR